VRPSRDAPPNLDRLLRRQQAARDIFEQIKALLSKADARRASASDNDRRWNRVLDHLERSLDEARARLERVDRFVAKAQCAGSDAVSSVSPADEDTVQCSGDDIQLSQDPAEAVTQVLALSLTDLSKLTMEQVALLHAQLPEQEIDLESADMERAEARIELANQTRRSAAADPSRPLSFTERRNQLILRAAINKARAGRCSDVTREERRLISSCYEMLCRRLDPDARDERLKALLKQAVDALGL